MLKKNKMSGLQREVKIMAIPEKVLCSPTSALDEGTNVEKGAEKSFLTDSDKLIVERHWYCLAKPYETSCHVLILHGAMLFTNRYSYHVR